jgi:hypothetical protein
MGRDNDPPDWWLEEEAADAAALAAEGARLEEAAREYLKAQKRPRGNPGTDTKHELVWFVENAIRHGCRASDAKAAAAKAFKVSKRYVQKLVPKKKRT